MDPDLDLQTVKAFATALLIGAMIGIEREKRKTETSDTSGLRTFILFAEVGAIAGWLSLTTSAPWPLAAAIIAVAGVVTAGYVVETNAKQGDRGLTTEIAAVVACLLGAMCTVGYQALAVGLAIATAAVLAYKEPLHGAVAKLGWDDVLAGVRLLIASFIVLPLLPNRPLDPWGALNPYSMWLMVLLISGLSLLGYVATRWLGTGKGTVMAGLTGGLVSSTAVTLSFSQQSHTRTSAAACYALACGIILAWCIMFGRVLVEVLVVNRALLVPILAPFAAMGAAAGVCAWIYFRRSAALKDESHEIALKNPFSLTSAARFAVVFTAVLLVVKIVQQTLPPEGMYAVAALAGLTDVDAITLSMAESAKTGNAAVAVTAIVIAALTNTLVKCGIVVVLGGPALKMPVMLAAGAILATGIAAIALF